MGLYTVHETREIVREALVDASDADEAMLFFTRLRTNLGAGKVDIHTNTDERHVIVKEYEEADK